MPQRQGSGAGPPMGDRLGCGTVKLLTRRQPISLLVHRAIGSPVRQLSLGDGKRETGTSVLFVNRSMENKPIG